MKVSSIVKKYIYLTLYFFGFPSLLRFLFQRDKVTILGYHQPNAVDFKHHLCFLKHYYNIISLRDYVAWRSQVNPVELPPYPLIITLDDGHRDNFDLIEILKQVRIPITIFICSRIVGTNRHYWWKHVEDAKERSRLKILSDEDRLQVLERDWGFLEEMEFSEPHALSSSELLTMATFVDFQAHTRFHPILSKCTPMRAEEEIMGSKLDLETEFNWDIYAFAYPNGCYSDRDVSLVESAGYSCALTVEGGYNDRNTDKFRLKRFMVQDDCNISELFVKTSGLQLFFRYLSIFF